MISIIVPIYNAEKYLDRCIKSVFIQTLTDWELILVNDGSNDNSLKICRRYADQDSRIRVIDKPNGGVSSARNAGIKRAQGDYISFLDADDYYSPEFLANFNSYKIQADFYSQGCICEYLDKSEEYRTHLIEGIVTISEFMESMISTMLISSPWGKLYRRNIIKETGLRFDERLNYAEDRLFNAAYLNHCNSFYLTDKASYHYTHENPDALTKRRYSSQKLLTYVTQYRPFLIKLLYKSALSQEIMNKASYSYNYDLILAIINKFRETRKYKDRSEFIRSIPKEFIVDASTQRNFPLIFHFIAKTLLYPLLVSIPAISLGITLKTSLSNK